MEPSLLQPRNWPRVCGCWAQEIRIALTAVPPRVAPVTGGWLRVIRPKSPTLALWLSLIFTLYCSRPATTPHPRTPTRDTVQTGTNRPFEEEGESSWYGGNGDGFAGKPTASGELFRPSALTCAHRTLPLGSTIEVENLLTGKRVLLRVNDRGPFARGRILDVSRKAAKELGFLGQGTARVHILSVDSQGRPAALDPDLDQRDPYTVQVAALSDPTNIDRLTRELEIAFGPVTFQDAATLDGRSVKRIRAGTYTKLAEAQLAAERIQKQLKDRGVDPFVTRRR